MKYTISHKVSMWPTIFLGRKMTLQETVYWKRLFWFWWKRTNKNLKLHKWVRHLFWMHRFFLAGPDLCGSVQCYAKEKKPRGVGVPWWCFTLDNGCANWIPRTLHLIFFSYPLCMATRKNGIFRVLYSHD